MQSVTGNVSNEEWCSSDLVAGDAVDAELVRRVERRQVGQLAHAAGASAGGGARLAGRREEHPDGRARRPLGHRAGPGAAPALVAVAQLVEHALHEACRTHLERHSRLRLFECSARMHWCIWGDFNLLNRQRESNSKILVNVNGNGVPEGLQEFYSESLGFPHRCGCLLYVHVAGQPIPNCEYVECV